MKKNLFVLLLLMISVSMTSCSNKKKKAEDTLTDNVEKEVEVDESDFLVDAEEKDEMEDSKSDDEIMADTSSDDEVMAQDEPSDSPVISEKKGYVVQKGDTYMWLAYKLYGDYSMWRKLKSENPNGLKAGSTIQYQDTGFVYSPKGLPHIIQSGETLMTISFDKYGTHKKWKGIWNNNRNVIKNPDIIFAGFTIHYIPDQRELASESEQM